MVLVGSTDFVSRGQQRAPEGERERGDVLLDEASVTLLMQATSKSQLIVHPKRGYSMAEGLQAEAEKP